MVSPRVAEKGNSNVLAHFSSTVFEFLQYHTKRGRAREVSERVMTRDPVGSTKRQTLHRRFQRLSNSKSN